METKILTPLEAWRQRVAQRFLDNIGTTQNRLCVLIPDCRNCKGRCENRRPIFVGDGPPEKVREFVDWVESYEREYQRLYRSK